MRPTVGSRQSTIREKMTESILEVLAELPELNRRAFVLNHYRGYPTDRVATVLGCRPAEVESMLRTIGSMLYHRIGALRAEACQADSGVVRQIECTADPSVWSVELISHKCLAQTQASVNVHG